MTQSPDHPLSGRVAIITGAGSGCGEAAALMLGTEGAQVCASDLNPDRADRVAGAVVAAGGSAFGWQADVSNKFQVAGMIEATRDHFSRLDLLVHNAHISPSGETLRIDEWEWRRAVDVNLTGAFFCAQLAARVMADEGGGLIVLLMHNVPPASSAGRAARAASVAGLDQLAGALSSELKDRGVTVLALEAGEPQSTADQLRDQVLSMFKAQPAAGAAR